MRRLAGGLHMHRLPPVVLGSGKTSLVHKFCATMHAFFLETGTKLLLQRMTEEIVSMTTDLGVEFGMSRIQPLTAHTVLPWMVVDHGLPVNNGLDLDDMEQLPDDEAKLHLTGALAAPGLLHILHNASNSLLGAMDSITEAVEQMAEVARLIRLPETCKRLCETCFADPIAQYYHGLLKAFKGNVHKERWGTIAHCTSELLELKEVLISRWDKDLYMGQQTAEHATNIDMVDRAIRSDMFWASLQCLELLMKVMRRCMDWCESCPCHYNLLESGAAVELERRWSRCPLRGRRLPEVAAGDFGNLFTELFDNMSAQALLLLPGALTASDRSRLLQDLARGRAHLAFQLTLKITAIRQPPLLLFAVAHHSAAPARDALRHCLESASSHPKIRQLQSGQLLVEAHEFLSGADLHDLGALSVFVASLKFGFAVERQVEGDHAAIHHGYGKARHHSEPYDSLVRRMPEIKQVMASGFGFESLCMHLESVRSPKLAVHSLGMASHSACFGITNAWDTMYRQLMYRSDPYTLYHQRYPEVSLDAPPPPRPASLPLQPPPAAPPPPGPLPPPLAETDGAQAQEPQSAASAASAALDASPPSALAPPAPPGSQGAAAPPASAGAVVEHLDETGAVGIYGALKKASAVSFFSYQLRAHQQDRKRYIYSIRMLPGAVRTLQNLLSVQVAGGCAEFADHWWSEGVVRSGPLQVDELQLEEMFKEMGMEQTFWFSVVAAAPSRAKRAESGHLSSSDIGLAFHKALAVNRRSKQVLVSLDPLNMKLPFVGDDVDAAPLVLSPSLLGFEHLSRLRAWEVCDNLRYTLDHSGEPLLQEPPLELGQGLGAHLHRWLELCTTPDEQPCEPEGGAHSDISKAVRAHYVEHNIIEEHVVVGERRWRLTQDGQRRLMIGQIVAQPFDVLAPRRLPIPDMTTFEVLCILEKQGFTFDVVSTKEQRRQVSKEPYRSDSPKVWFIDAGKPNYINKNYLILLATAEEHGNDVPHLRSAGFYTRLLRGGDFQRCSRKRRRLAIATYSVAQDEWDEVDYSALSAPPRRRTSGLRALASSLPGPIQAAAQAAAPVLDAGSGESAADDSMDESDCSSSSSSPSSSCVRSSQEDSGQEEAKQEEEVEDEEEEQEAAAEAAHPAAAEDLDGQASQEVHPSSGSRQQLVQRATGTRNLQASTPYGQCRITPRLSAAGQLQGWQMSCMHPAHKGGAQCQKSLSARQAGGETMGLRMLKTWVTLGFDLPSKQSHAETWAEVLRMRESGSLPSDSDLDALAPLGWN